MMIKLTISLTDEQHAFAKALVDNGRYPTLNAVLQQGVDLLRLHRLHTDAEAAEGAALRELLSRRRNGEKRSAHGISS